MDTADRLRKFNEIGKTHNSKKEPPGLTAVHKVVNNSKYNDQKLVILEGGTNKEKSRKGSKLINFMDTDPLVTYNQNSSSRKLDFDFTDTKELLRPIIKKDEITIHNFNRTDSLKPKFYEYQEREFGGLNELSDQEEVSEKQENEESVKDVTQNIIEAKENLCTAIEIEEHWDHKKDKIIFERDNIIEEFYHSNKPEIELKDRIIINYISDKKNPSIPQFTKIDNQKLKCQIIMKFDSELNKSKTHYFYDDGICLEFRRKIYGIRKRISSVCYELIKSPIFDNFILLIIMVNTSFIFISDPTDSNSLQELSDNYFLFMYTGECVLKISAYGFVQENNSYLRDTWNLLDFVVVVLGWVSYLIQIVLNGQSIPGLGALRAIRTLRPLKSIKSITGLRLILETLFGSIAGLKDTLIVLFFFFLLFAVGGVQMWSGTLKNRCINTETGNPLNYSSYKSACTMNEDTCNIFNTKLDSFKCATVDHNPYYDAMSFDSIIKSMILVLVIATMEGWSEYFNYLSNTFKGNAGINSLIVFLYFHVLLFVGGYYLINLFLAVINETFQKIDHSNKIESLPKEKKLIDVLSKNSNEKSKKKKNMVESEESEIEKLKKRTIFIEKDVTKIPIEYQTLKDLLLLKSNSPEEMHLLKKEFLEESKKIMLEFEKEKVEIKRTLNSKKREIANKNLHQNFPKRKITFDINMTKDKLQRNIHDPSTGATNGMEKIKKHKIDLEIIETAIARTISNFDKFIGSKKAKLPDKLDIQTNNNNNKDTDISEEDHNLRPNWMEQESSSMHSEEVQNVTNIFMRYIQEANAVIPDHKVESKSKLLKDFNVKRNIKHINDISESDLSNSDMTLSFDQEREQKIQRMLDCPVLMLQDKNKDALAVIKSKIEVNQNDYVSNIVTFLKPVLSVTEINRQIEYNLQKKKEELAKSQRKVEAEKSHGILDPRANFLSKVESKYDKQREEEIKKDFQKYDQELENMDSLVISMCNDDNLIISDNHQPVFAEENIMNDNFLVPQELIEHRETLELEESKPLNPISPPNNTAERFYNTGNLQNKNQDSPILKQLSSPSKAFKIKSFIPIHFDDIKNIDGLTKLHILNSKQQHLLTRRQVKEDIFGVIENSKSSKRSILMRRKSIDKTKLKYPVTVMEDPKLSVEDKSNDNIILKKESEDPSINTKEKNLQVRSGMRTFRNNASYFFNLMEKDVFVKDVFELKDYNEDILGAEPHEIVKRIEEERDPMVIFNPKGVRLIQMQYIPYKSEYFNEDDIVQYDHALKNFDSKIIDSVPLHNFNEKRRNRDNDEALPSATSSTLKTFASSSTMKTTISGTSMNSNTLMSRNSSVNKMNAMPTSRTNFISDIACSSLDSIKYSLLSKEFLNEVGLIPVKVNKNAPKRIFKGKSNHNDVKGEIHKIRTYDQDTNIKKNIICSHQDILNQEDDPEMYDDWNRHISSLEQFNVILWKSQPFFKQMHILRYLLFRLSVSQAFDLFIILVVIVNAVFMALDGNLLLPDEFSVLDDSKYVFNSLYIFEFIAKVIGLGPILYFSELFSYLDVAIICFALVEMATGGNTTLDLSRLSFLRVFRIFRVLRLLKVLRKIKSVRKIITGITKAIGQIYYILLILLIFIFIFQLIGMTLLNGNKNYTSFLNAFYVTFQLLTLENWNMNIVDLGKFSEVSVIYLILWIFFGNFVLFNLFLSILLESFVEAPYAGIVFPKDYPETFKNIELQEEQLKNKIKEKKKKVGADDDSDETDSDEGEEVFTNSKTISDTKLIKKLFMGNQCEFSVFIFSQKGWFRGKLIKLVHDKRFENLILTIIILSTARLIAETFTNQEDDFTPKLFDFLDLSFNLIFIFECLAKILSLGFIMNKGTYLRDSWNKLDFFIVMISMFDMEQLISKYLFPSANSVDIGFLKVLRMLRILRPLRFISHNVQLKLMINCLLDSIQAIINVFLIVLVVFFIMSIVGITLFNNEFDENCIDLSGNVITNFKNLTQTLNIDLVNNPLAYHNLCYQQQGTMDQIPQFLFSNVFNSMITSYVLSTMEGWPDIMGSYRNYSQIYGLFFILYILIVSYFFMNLFIGVMFSTYNDAIQKEKKKGIQDDTLAQRYLDFLSLLNTAKPDYTTYRKKINKYSILFTKITSNSLFENFIMSIIMLNMITMAIDFDGSEPTYSDILLDFNYVFTAIFFCEFILKLIANGFQGYFYYGWNKFDSFVVFASLIDILMSKVSSNPSFLKSFQIIRVLRVLRVTRVLRLFKSLKGLEKILQTVQWSVQALGNVLILLLLIIFIFSVLGSNVVSSFSYEDYSNDFFFYDEYFNFNNFYTGFLLVFRSATGENWHIVMLELANKFSDLGSNPLVVYLFMIAMNFLTFVIMINLFMLVVLQQYEELNSKDENPIAKFNDILVAFKTAWNIYSTEADDGYRLKNHQLTLFLQELDTSEFDSKFNKTIEEIKKYIVDLKLLRDKDGYVYFHDVLFKIFRKEYGLKEKKIRLISKEEKKIQLQIQKKINSFINKFENSKLGIDNTLNTFNPLTAHLYFKTSYFYATQLIKNYQDIMNKKALDLHRNKPVLSIDDKLGDDMSEILSDIK